MPVFKKLTPNLLVSSVERSRAFYVDTLGFERGMTVPDASPFAFAAVTGGGIEIFFNDAAGAVKEYPGFAGGVVEENLDAAAGHRREGERRFVGHGQAALETEGVHVKRETAFDAGDEQVGREFLEDRHGPRRIAQVKWRTCV